MKIFVAMPEGVTRDSFITEECKRRLAMLGDVEYNTTTEQLTGEEIKEKLVGADVVITGWGSPMLDEAVLKDNDTLKIIAHTGGTVTSVVDDYAYDKGIKVISGNDVYAESVAESIVAYSLLGLRKIPKYMKAVEENGWRDCVSDWDGLLDQTVGFVSFGMIPKHLVRLLKPFRVKIKVYSSHISDEELEEYGMERATLEEVFSSCKVISVHSALTEKTYHMIGKELFELIPDGAVFVNTSRGAVLDEAALIEELKKERFTAVLDVYEQEPMPIDYPLRKMSNVYALPHMGGPTYDRREFVTFALIDDIVNFNNGKRLRMEITSGYHKHMTKQ